MNIREKLVEEIVEQELFHTFVVTENGEELLYVAEGFDKEKMEAEGSTWIVYVYDTMNEYYQKYKKRIDDTVDGRLVYSLSER